MHIQRLLLSLSALFGPAALLAQTGPAPANLMNPAGSNLQDAYQTEYVSNLNTADAVVNIANAGSSAGNIAPTSSNVSGDICANVYVYQANEQLLACCSCGTTPNGLYSWPVIFGSRALLANATTRPSSLAIKLVATSPSSNSTAGSPVCDPTFQKAPLSLVPGLAAWSTHPHLTPSPNFAITETAFSDSALSTGEAYKLQSDCLSLGSTRQCPGCSNAGLAEPGPVAEK